MNIQNVITKKRDGKKLSNEEIEYFIEEYTKGNVKDYHAAALVMAMYLNKLDEEETTNLTLAMANSGDVLDLKELGTVIDKHSSGGVGDKVTLILTPIISALGIPVAKLSGRGLGFTGGTIDKLESIPGYQTSISTEEFINNVKKIGISVASQSANLAPADKKLYALRDVINCIDNKSLIASSIMSKKIAAGADKIVLDVTCGDGAFMKTKKDAIELSKIMKKIGCLANRETVCVITSMQEPLGKAVGNSLEVIEAIKFLNNEEVYEDLKEVVYEIGAQMILLSGKENNIVKAKKLIDEVIKNKKALNKFKQLVETQKGDTSYIEDISKFKKASITYDITAKNSGYIKSILAQKIGEASVCLGAGRRKIDDVIDFEVGMEFYKKVGDKVNVGETILKIYANDKDKLNMAIEKIESAIEISNCKTNKIKTILKIV